MTHEELKAIVDKHTKWLRVEGGGSRADLSGAVLRGADLSDVVLRGADLSRAVLSGADLSRANLIGADLRGAVLRRADLSRAVLSRAVLSRADLRGAVLRGADLSDAVLSRADLIDVDLRRAVLSRAVLSSADLSGADLSGADLRRADLRGADLRGAVLSDAVLSRAVLSDIKSDFINAILLLPNEIPFLRQAIVDGRIDGSSYTGECACLAGTMAQACGMKWVDFAESQKFPIADSSPRERWFLGIRTGDTPENNQISAITLEWIDEALQMVDRIRAAPATH